MQYYGITYILLLLYLYVRYSVLRRHTYKLRSQQLRVKNVYDAAIIIDRHIIIYYIDRVAGIEYIFSSPTTSAVIVHQRIDGFDGAVSSARLV